MNQSERAKSAIHLFILKNSRLQLVKINHVISNYLSLTDKIVRLWTLTFVSWCTIMVESSVYLNNWIYESKCFLLSFYSNESCPLSEYTLKWFGGLSGARPAISRLLDKFEVWVSCEAACYMIDQFFCLIF